jgi:hypothetical protein
MVVNVTDRLAGWTPERLQAFGQAPLMLPHDYHSHDLFSDEALARGARVKSSGFRVSRCWKLSGVAASGY